MTDEEKEMTVKEYHDKHHDKHGVSTIIDTKLGIHGSEDKEKLKLLFYGSGTSGYYVDPLEKMKDVFEAYGNRNNSIHKRLVHIPWRTLYGYDNEPDCDTNIT